MPLRDPSPEARADVAERATALEGELLAVMEQGFGADRFAAPGSDPALEELALRVLRHQAQANPTYGTLLRNRGLDPDTLERWTDFPPVPARAFRDDPPYLSDDPKPEAVFMTSGTTGAPGTHRVRSLALYHGSLLPTARHFLELPPEGAPLRFLALLPDPGERPTSSLVHMAGVLAREVGDGVGGFYLEADWSLRASDFREALARAWADQAPVLLTATAFALVHWLDASAREGWGATPLPPGSRILETGGFKGRSREVERARLYAELSASFGIDPARIVNEYGMTEMLSQFYEPVLLEGGPADPGARRHLGPPWVCTRILDPATLDPVRPGEPGLLCHLDLANLHSAALILTEDLGVQVGEGPEAGFRVLGRSVGAVPRGCSLSMEAWLEAGEAPR